MRPWCKEFAIASGIACLITHHFKLNGRMMNTVAQANYILHLIENCLVSVHGECLGIHVNVSCQSGLNRNEGRKERSEKDAVLF